MAHLHLLREPLEVRTRTTYGVHGSAPGIYTTGTSCSDNTVVEHHTNLTLLWQLPDSIKQDYARVHNTNPSPDVLKFCKRELYQQVWKLLLDPEFCEAYKNGFVIQCGDGVTRRLFPRFFTYSADYPEK